MSELQLTHIALVGARMSAFSPYGYKTREELTMRRVVPDGITSAAIEQLSANELRNLFITQLPIWIHNIIVDPGFPQRHKLLMPLRRFEGELRDSKYDEVVSLVLQHGFRNQNLDPFDLPKTMPMRQRCALVVHIGVWQEAFQHLENGLLDLLTADPAAIARWCDYARQPDNCAVEID